MGKNALFIICVYEKELLAIAPFMLSVKKKLGLSCRTLKFLGKGDYLNIILRTHPELSAFSIIGAIFSIVASNAETFDRLQLTHIRHDSPLSAFFLRSEEFNGKFSFLAESPVLSLGRYENLAEYKRIFYAKSINNYINRMKKAGGYAFSASNNKHGRDVYEEISLLHQKQQQFLRRKQGRRQRRSVFADPHFAQFLKALYAENENILTFLLRDGKGNLIFYDSCYLQGNTLHSWNIGLEPEYLEYRIGRIANFEIIKYLFEHKPQAVFDFGAGRYPWKFAWTDRFVVLYQLDAWNGNKKARFLRFLVKLKRLLARIREIFNE
jgi:hypothetical protein